MEVTLAILLLLFDATGGTGRCRTVRRCANKIVLHGGLYDGSWVVMKAVLQEGKTSSASASGRAQEFRRRRPFILLESCSNASHMFSNTVLTSNVFSKLAFRVLVPFEWLMESHLRGVSKRCVLIL